MSRSIRALVTLVTLGLTIGVAAAVAPDARPAAGPAMWVFFVDKSVDDPAAALAATAATYPPRALARRALRRTAPGLVDGHDLPVAHAYVEAVLATGADRRIVSRWLNAMSVDATAAELDAIRRLPFVADVRPVATQPSRGGPVAPARPLTVPTGGPIGGDPYGASTDQLLQIGVIAMHDQGFTGDGVIIGVLDTGFHRVHEAFFDANHPLTVLAEYDFINDDGDTDIEDTDPEAQHRHGTWILGTMAAYRSTELVGAAFDASYILCKTEDVSGETPIEEDYYVAGLEFIEFNGGDVATSSLSYSDWYVPGDMDGQTAVTTIAVNLATANGLVCCTAAGNAGHDDDPATHHLGAPADALEVITCGAVDVDGLIAGFSSDGPTVDGRVKPEVLARGVGTATVHSTNESGYSAVSGTSLSTPLVAGAVALLVQAHPDWTVPQLRDALFTTADYAVANGTNDPLFVLGYGIMNAAAASAVAPPLVGDLDGDGLVDAADLAAMLAQWGPCPPPCAADLDDDGAVGASDLAILLAHWS
ncbi:MAG: S8 family serine peptidase [Phycisphaerales bacterium]|nr:S8 family serine peptidase [Phycisphaerales bacterium]